MNDLIGLIAKCRATRLISYSMKVSCMFCPNVAGMPTTGLSKRAPVSGVMVSSSSSSGGDCG